MVRIEMGFKQVVRIFIPINSQAKPSRNLKNQLWAPEYFGWRQILAL